MVTPVVIKVTKRQELIVEHVAVDCKFKKDGTVRVMRVKVGDLWLPVTQGRQWQDDDGRHILIMLDDTKVRTLSLNPQSLTWEITPDQPPDTAAV